MEQFQPDIRWSIFGAESFEEYLGNIKIKIFIHPQAHQQIKDRFELIDKLLSMAYYEFQLWDVVANLTLQSLELSLKVRYEEIVGSEWPKNKNLEKLLKWFNDQKYFEYYDTNALNQIRNIRNIFIHTKHHSILGAGWKKIIMHIITLINDTYRDKPKRERRQALRQTFASSIKNIAANTMGLKMSSRNEEYILSDISLLNIEVDPELHYIVPQPIFEIGKNGILVNNKPYVFSPIIVESIEWGEREAKFIVSNNKEQLTMKGLSAGETNALANWKSKIHPGDGIFDRLFQVQIELDNFTLEQHYRNQQSD